MSQTMSPSLFSFGSKKNNFRVVGYPYEKTERKKDIFSTKEEAILLTKSLWEKQSSDALENFFEGVIETVESCSQDNWDGYGAKPLNINSIYYALMFVLSLPKILPLPELVAEPNGELGIQWASKGNSLAVSIDSNKNITFGGISENGGEIYGTTKFSEEIPDVLLAHIKAMFK